MKNMFLFSKSTFSIIDDDVFPNMSCIWSIFNNKYAALDFSLDNSSLSIETITLSKYPFLIERSNNFESFDNASRQLLPLSFAMSKIELKLSDV